MEQEALHMQVSDRAASLSMHHSGQQLDCGCLDIQPLDTTFTSTGIYQALHCFVLFSPHRWKLSCLLGVLRYAGCVTQPAYDSDGST